MKARIKLNPFELRQTRDGEMRRIDCMKGYEGHIEFQLDETYWRNEFAKAAMQGRLSGDLRGWGKLDRSDICKDAFDYADAMIEEMKKRKDK